jgi:hypothetical protein
VAQPVDLLSQCCFWSLHWALAGRRACCVRDPSKGLDHSPCGTTRGCASSYGGLCVSLGPWPAGPWVICRVLAWGCLFADIHQNEQCLKLWCVVSLPLCLCPTIEMSIAQGGVSMSHRSFRAVVNDWLVPAGFHTSMHANDKNQFRAIGGGQFVLLNHCCRA